MKQILQNKQTNILGCLILALLILFNPVEIVAQELLAFPGADGFGKYTTGGRGGDIYEVTTLNDSGPGSLREAVEADGPRIIIFGISGTIELNTDLKIENDDISIFGQTAPGDGIALSGRSTVIQADNVIIQYIRFRPGDIGSGDLDGLDALWGREQSDIMLDHLSMSWSIDETGSFYDNENFTLQWSVLSESLYDSEHGKGTHGYGGIWGGMGASFHHNLFAHHTSRNPRFNGSRYSGNAENEMVDYRNNVIYNWEDNSAYAAEGGSYNIVNNYYKPGPATEDESRIIQPWPDNGGNNQPAGVYGQFYIDGNIVIGDADVTEDNWLGVHPSNDFSDYGITKEDLKVETAFDVGEFTLASEQTAEEAYLSVLENSGAILPRRDEVDARIMNEVETGTATFGNDGIIDSQEDVGGWPELQSAAGPEDTDGDGIPDEWETENGLDPDNPDDAAAIAASGYANIEEYIHSITPASGEFEPVPGPVALLDPVRESDIPVLPVFTWEPANFANNYEMEIRDAANENANVIFTTTINDTTVTLEEELEESKTYFWRVRGLNDQGSGTWTNFEYFITETPTSNELRAGIPNDFVLEQNYPNPFNPTTNIRYGLPQRSNVDIRVFDMAGREVARHMIENQQAGFHTIEFNFESLASGVYVYKLQGVTANGSKAVFIQTRKMTLIK